MDADTHKIGHASDLEKGSASRSQADRPCAILHEEKDYGAAVPWPQRLGNATAVALAGFLLSLSPLSCMLMGWRGSSSNGATATGMYMFGGGGLLWFGGLGEWLVGNTFASVVFFAFGAFWLNFGAALIPSFNAYGSYSPSAEDPELGLLTVAYNSGWGFMTLSMAFLNTIFLIAATRTNITFVLMFACVISALSCLTGAFWQTSNNNSDLAEILMVAGGGCFFGACACGWWCLASIILVAVDFPYQLPLGDLSRHVKGKSQRKQVRGKCN